MRRLLPLLCLTTACNSFLNVPPPPPPPPGTPQLQTLSTSFSSPLYLTTPPADSARLFVVERGGRIRIMRNDTLLAGSFLNLTGKIASGSERGLLSLAFHPLYAANGRFYVYFTDPTGDIRVVRYNVSTNPDSADETTADTVLKIAHPFFNNNNGGQLQFSPDGKLFIGTGDGGGGGGAGDTARNAQNTHKLLGKLLRLNVDGASGYTIPADNPFAGDTSLGSPEIWSYGLRNPWRFSFDREAGDIYIGDVGQDSWEEVDVSGAAVQVGRGANYGWNTMEGQHCYQASSCTMTGLVLPVVEYPHSIGACSITGGYVYRGTKMPALAGHYFYADYCNGFVLSFRYSGGNVTTRLDWTQLLSPGSTISSFGQDAKGELYILTLNGGVYRIVPRS